MANRRCARGGTRSDAIHKAICGKTLYFCKTYGKSKCVICPKTKDRIEPIDWDKEGQNRCIQWEQILIWDLGMQSVLSKSKKIPIQHLKNYLDKLSSKKIIIVYMHIKDFHETYEQWDQDLQDKYAENYILRTDPEGVLRLITLKSEQGIGGAIIAVRRQVKEGSVYIYDK